MICRKCGVDKDSSGYYVSDPNNCKDCIKKKSALRESILRQDPEWCEKERLRAKDKYYRLGYRTRQFELNNSKKYKTNNYKMLHRRCVDSGLITNEEKLHHWNYMFPNQAFVISEKDHRKLHTKLVLSDNQDIFYTKDGVALDTIEKHIEIIKSVTDQYRLIEYKP